MPKTGVDERQICATVTTCRSKRLNKHEPRITREKLSSSRVSHNASTRTTFATIPTTTTTTSPSSRHLHRNHGRSHSPHPQVHSQPIAWTQADGRVRLLLTPRSSIRKTKHKTRKRLQCSNVAHRLSTRSQSNTLPPTVMSSTLSAPTSPRKTSAPSSPSYTSATRSPSPSSVSAPSSVVARAPVSRSSTTRKQR